MPDKSHISSLILLLTVLLLSIKSCKEDDINLNPRMVDADLSDKIPFTELTSGKLLFTRGYTSYLIDIDNQSVSELIIDPVGGSLLSPDGVTIAFITYEEKLHLWNLVENDQITHPFVNVDFNLFSWSPDSKKLYYSIVYTNKLYQLNLDKDPFTRTFIRQFPPYATDYRSPFSVSVSGDFAFYATSSDSSEELADAGLYTMNPEGKELECISRWEGETTRYSHCSPKWSPDGQTIAYLSIINHEESSNQEIILINKDGTNPRTIVKKEIPYPHVPFEGWAAFQYGISLCWSPDGSCIAFIGMEDEIESHIYVVDIDTQELIQVTSEKDMDDRYLSWSK